MTNARYKLENGQGMMKFCRANKIPYASIWERVALKNMTPDEAIKDFIEQKGKPKYCRYYYKGTTFRKYCKEHNLKYQTIIDYKRFWDIPLEEAIKKYERL